MFDKLKKIIKSVIHLSDKLDKYEKESVIQAMPSVAYVNRAKKCIERSDYAEAERILEEAMELPQEDALVYKYLGIICERTKRPTEATIAYKKSANLDPHDKEIWRLLGFALVNNNLCDEAVEAFENADKISPNNTDVFAGWGMAFMKLKNYEAAHEKFMEAVKINKYNFMALLLAGVMEVRTGHYNEAESKLNFLANVCPNETNTYEYANLKYIKCDYDNAIHYAKKSIEYNKGMLPSYLLLGKLYAIKGMKKESLETYQKAYEMNLLSPNLFYDWAVTLQIFGEYEMAKINFLKAHEYAPEESELTAGIVLIHALLGENEEAQLLLKDLKNIDKSCYIYVKALAVLDYNRGEYEKALAGFKSLEDKMFFDNTLNLFIAQCYENLNDVPNAKSYYDKALLNGSDNLKIYAAYSHFLIKIKEFADAQRKLARGLKLDENNTELLNLFFYVNYILVKQNNCEYNIKEALSAAEKIRKIDAAEFKYAEELSDLENIAKNR